MAKVDTNVIRIAYARETSAGTKSGAGARVIEPNEITQFGASITTTPREPISDKLQRRKGTPTDLDSATAFTTDLTVDSFWDWIEAALFARSYNYEVRKMAALEVNSTGDYYRIASADFTGSGEAARRRAKMHDEALIWAEGFTADANNGLKIVDTDATNNGRVSVDESLTTGGTGSTTATLGFISLAGVRFAGGTAGSTWQYSASTGEATLTRSGVGNDVTDARGLRAGMIVHFGSVASKGGDLQRGIAPDTRPATATGDTGFARFVRRTANTLVFDRVDEALRKTTAVDLSGTNAEVHMVFGDFIRNVSRSDGNYVQRSHTIELVSPDLFGDGDDGYEYAVGQVISTLALNFPLTDKATMTVNFVGTDTETPVQAANRESGFSNADTSTLSEAVNTSSDFARLRILDADDDGITTDFKSLTITINPQTTPEKVVGKLGAKFINRGNLLVDIEAQVIFTDDGVISAVRDNTTTRFETIVGNSDGVMHFEVPSMTLSGGGREYPANQSVLVNSTGQSFEDETYETSMHVSFLPVPVPID